MGGLAMRKKVGVLLGALVLSIGVSFVAAPSADAFCMADPGTGSGCGRCPELKVIKVYCLQ
jgi:hypothetical protein